MVSEHLLKQSWPHSQSRCMCQDCEQGLAALCCGLQVLYDLGMVSHKEPFQQLVSQGMILGELEYVVIQQSDGCYSQDGQGQGTPVRYVQELFCSCPSADVQTGFAHVVLD